MHEGDRCLDGGVVEVGVEATHLRGNEHALVYDGAARHGAGVENLSSERGAGVRAFLDGAATQVKRAFEIIPRLDALGASHERLDDGGHAGAGGRAEVVRVDGDGAPEQQGQAGCRAPLFEHASRVERAALILREEQHCDAVVALLRQDLPAFLRLLAEESMRDLEEDARAVPGVALKSHAPAVLEVDECGKRVVKDLMTARPVDVGECGDAAGVVFEFGAV